MTRKQQLKGLVPSWMLRLRQNLLERKYRNLSDQDIFTKIYHDGLWGRPGLPNQKFFSGSGSHEPHVVRAYVEAVESFTATLSKRLDSVDLGCGDFSTGSKLRPFFNNYIACDIVEPLVEYNRTEFGDLNVDFRVLDITQDDLPTGDIAVLRQVLQHLSNKQIESVLSRVAATYKYLLLTEHLPLTKGFKTNLDKPAGPHTRFGFHSGLVVTDPPFSLKCVKELLLCEVPSGGGMITTTLYELA